MKEDIYIFFQVRLFDIIFMFKMTDFIIFAERFMFFLRWPPFFIEVGNIAPSFSKLEWTLVSQCLIKLIFCTCNNYE